MIRDGRRPNGDVYRAGRRLWSAADDALLRRRYPHEPTAALARELRRSLVATYQRARVLGLEKTDAYLASPAACRLRRREGEHPGRATQFRPGQVPPNKGLRRPGWAPGRMAATQFKAGARPHTWVPVGTEVVDRDGYHKRKVADDRRPPRFNWKFVHVLVWEAAHGPVPTGHAVAFRNGDNRRYPRGEPRARHARRRVAPQQRPQPAEGAGDDDPAARCSQTPDSTEK